MYSYHNDDIFSRPIKTLQENVDRFRKFGKIITRVAKNKKTGESAKIGKLEIDGKETVYVIFYPNGTFDRFEDGSKVLYRMGWTGPDLTSNRVDDYLAEMIIEAGKEVEAEIKVKTKTEKSVPTPKTAKDREREAALEKRRIRARERYAEQKAEGTLPTRKKKATIH